MPTSGPAMARSSLPIDALLPSIVATLRDHPACVVAAPPGSGKTTRIALALLPALEKGRSVWLLGPRRLTVRAAAERIAAEMGEPIGRAVGYQTRNDSRTGPANRIIVMTHGVFVQRIIAEPDLPGVGAVLFDEVHERTLPGDLALTLARDAVTGLALDTRLVAMSATIDTNRFARFLDDAPVLECAATPHPLEVIHLPARSGQSLEDAAASAAMAHLSRRAGDVLVFCPGIASIQRVGRALRPRLPAAVDCHELWGGATSDAQRAALKASPEGRQRVVLATAIAESGVTLDGVSGVVDLGLARRAVEDGSTGLARLVTVLASRAALAQRAGRAARQGPGTAYRLWPAPAESGRQAYDPPEISTAPLEPLVIDLCRWGAASPDQLSWLDPPAPTRWARALNNAQDAEAVDRAGRLTELGRAAAALGVDLPLAVMLLRCAAEDLAVAADLALLLTDPPTDRRSLLISERLRSRTRGQDAVRGATRLAERARAARIERDWPVLADAGAMLAYALPGRISRRRDACAGTYVSLAGPAFVLPADGAFPSSEWIVIADAQGTGDRRILLAEPICFEVARTAADQLFEERAEVRYDPKADAVRAQRVRRLGAVVLETTPLPRPDPDFSIDARLQWLADHPDVLTGPEGVMRCWLGRLTVANVEGVNADAIQAGLVEWGPLALATGQGLRDVAQEAWLRAIESWLPTSVRRELELRAPRWFVSPAGTRHEIDYAGDDPTVRCRMTALYGLNAQPLIGSPARPIRFELTSPADRVIHTTSDLPGFWAGSYRDVARDMRGRYPRHVWPDDPANALPTLRAKPRAR